MAGGRVDERGAGGPALRGARAPGDLRACKCCPMSSYPREFVQTGRAALYFDEYFVSIHPGTASTWAITWVM